MSLLSRVLLPVVLVVLYVLPGVPEVQAQTGTETIDTNRPGFSWTPTVVPRGRWQLESAVAYDRSQRTLAAPLAELRYGLGEGVELFASSINWIDGEAGDIALGSKLALAKTPPGTQLAILLQLSMPTGGDEYSSDSFDPSAAFIWSHAGALPAGLSLAGTAKVSHVGNQLQLDNAFKLVLPADHGLSAFLEWEMNFSESGRDAHWLNGACQWLLNRRLQLDFSLGLGIDAADGDYRLAVGLSHLF